MKNVFIFSDSFHTYEFVNVIDHLLNFSVNDICLLHENHDIKEFGSKRDKIKIYDNIQQCIDNSEIIILLNSPYLPINVSTQLKEIAKINKKAIVDIDYNMSSYNMNSYKNNYNESIPVILNISIGDHSANFCLEILLNKIFSRYHIDFCQEYSARTSGILRQLNENGILNTDLCTIKSARGITIKHLNYSNFQEMSDNSIEIQAQFPDYIILNTNYRLNEYNRINDYIYYRYGIPSFIVKSNFVEVYRAERSMKCVYCNAKQKGVNYINDATLEQTLEIDIFSHLSFPDKICIL